MTHAAEKKKYPVEHDGDFGSGLPGSDPPGRHAFVASDLQSAAHCIYRCVIHSGKRGVRNRTCDDHTGSAVYVFRPVDFTGLNSGWRAGSHCLCDRVLPAPSAEDHDQGEGCAAGKL